MLYALQNKTYNSQPASQPTNQPASEAIIIKIKRFKRYLKAKNLTTTTPTTPTTTIIIKKKNTETNTE